MRRIWFIMGVCSLVLTAGSLALNHFMAETVRPYMDAQAQSYERFGDLPGRYDSAVNAAYMSSCESGTDSISFCRCTLKGLSADYSQTQFLAMDAKVAKNPKALPQNVKAIYQRCLRSS